MPLQAKILTVLERREVTRVGSNKPTPIDIRLVCATDMPLHQMIEEGRFRQDLLYRIEYRLRLTVPAQRTIWRYSVGLGQSLFQYLYQEIQ